MDAQIARLDYEEPRHALDQFLVTGDLARVLGEHDEDVERAISPSATGDPFVLQRSSAGKSSQACPNAMLSSVHFHRGRIASQRKFFSSSVLPRPG